MRTKKTLCLLLALPLLLFACQNPGSGGTTETSDQGGDIADHENSEPTENPLYIDALPERDFGGYLFNMLTWPYIYANTELVVEEQTGDTIPDAIYLANKTLEDRFNVNFKQLYAPDTNQIVTYVKKAVNSGDNAYDAALIVDRDALGLAMSGKFFYNVNELPHVDLDRLYWDQELKKALTIDNVLYFAYGAHNLSVYGNVNFLVYNKAIATELGLENMYDLVRGGKWTVDKLYEMAAAAVKDLDGDGKMTKNDRWGVALFTGWYYPSFWMGEKIPLVAKDENDLPYFNVPGNEALFNLFEKLYAHTAKGFDYIRNEDFREVFDNGLSLFMASTMYDVQRLRAMETDYGILPYPRMSEAKPGEPYVGRLAGGFPLIVPVTADAERASVVLEALACEYQRRVIPNYYEVAVQVKSTRDEESIEILDMLMKNRFLDFGDCLWTWDIRVKYTDIFESQTNNFQSVTEKITGSVEKMIEKAIAVFREANG